MKKSKVGVAVLGILIIGIGGYYFLNSSDNDGSHGVTPASTETTISTSSDRNNQAGKKPVVVIDQSSLDTVSTTRTISGTANTSSVTVQLYTYNTGKGNADGNATPAHWYEGKPGGFVPVENGKWTITLPADLFPPHDCWTDQLAVSVGVNIYVESAPFKLCAK